MLLQSYGIDMDRAGRILEYFIKHSADNQDLRNLTEIHIELLLKWQNIANLIGLSNEREIAEFLYLDSFLALKRTNEYLLSEKIRISNIADIGSGAGFPSLFWSFFLPGANVTLFEPKRKKANFLREFIRIAGLKNYKVEEKMVQRESLSAQLIISKAAININDWPYFSISNLAGGGVAVSLLTEESEKIYTRAIKKTGKIAKSVLIEYELPYSLKRRLVGVAVKK